MYAVIFDDGLRVVSNRPVPEPPPGWALIRVRLAGICKTDMEIIKGYMGFKGVLGHEFIGTVEKCDDSEWIGRQVAGEINASCGRCDMCKKDLQRHCFNRSVLGIQGLDGCMADFCTLPLENLVEIPKTVSDNQAVFVEPLSAACEILEQINVYGSERAVILGDGRLGILCSWVLSTVFSDITIVGHHPEKLKIAKWRHVKTTSDKNTVAPGADIVVDATGSAKGLEHAISLCRPRGTIVLKTTVAAQGELNLAPVVINELTLLGSRCGQFKDGLKIMETYPDIPLEKLITARYPIEQALEAFDRARQKDVIKVLIDCFN